MTCHPEPPSDVLARFNIQSPVFAAQSKIATVWKVRRHDGQPAALKIYLNDDLKDEGPGFSLLRQWDGTGTVRLYDISGSAVLLEWLDGRSLGDLTRSGQDAKANRHLVKTACKIHSTGAKAPPDLPHLTDWFAALDHANQPADWSAQTRYNMQRARTLAHALLADQSDIRPLHGDLHHDNIKRGARGYLAFDAKGVIGDRGFELANAFKNPVGADRILQNPRRIKHLAQSWGQAIETAPVHLLSWACAYCALSMTWHLNDGEQPDTVMLNLLCDALDASQ